LALLLAPDMSQTKKILVIGAGRSSSNLIQYLLEHAAHEGWQVRVGDVDLHNAQQKIAGFEAYGEAFVLDGQNHEQRRTEIAQADLVISMLPAFMHMAVAKDCLEFGKNVITPSYIPDEMWALDEEAKAKGIVLLNEMGVDPGIDHMSAMEIIHRLMAEGAELESFESFTGGLVAPESDNNPWNYKITWNPRNVVLAGYGGTARYQESGSMKYIPYNRLFKEITPVEIDGYGQFDGYANRDSLKYMKIYGLEQIPTLYRGTLRRGGYCKAWDALISLGLTDDSFEIAHPERLTWRQLTMSFLPSGGFGSLEQQLFRFCDDDVVYQKLIWLGLLEEIPLGLDKGTPAMMLQKRIETLWVLGPEDKDMIVMWHRFRFKKAGVRQEICSSLITLGDDPVYTGMSKTVGLPIAIAAKKILRGELQLSGVTLPVNPQIYVPILEELRTFGIEFKEQHSILS
jgi:saccharopine dehydrogenase-like NADP-dependent oxidoreductase